MKNKEEEDEEEEEEEEGKLDKRDKLNTVTLN